MTTPQPTSSSNVPPHSAPAPFEQLSLAAFLDATAAKLPTPGGGAVSGACGALACALGHMVVAYSLGKKNLVQHQEMLAAASARLKKAQSVLLQLANEDAQAYALVNELSRLPEGDPRREQLPLATLASAQIPLAAAACALDVLRLLVQLCGASNTHLRSDLAIAAILADATVKSSRWNVTINVPGLADGAQREAMQEQIDSFVQTSSALAHDIESRCQRGW